MMLLYCHQRLCQGTALLPRLLSVAASAMPKCVLDGSSCSALSTCASGAQAVRHSSAATAYLPASSATWKQTAWQVGLVGIGPNDRLWGQPPVVTWIVPAVPEAAAEVLAARLPKLGANNARYIVAGHRHVQHYTLRQQNLYVHLTVCCLCVHGVMDWCTLTHARMC